MLNIESLKTKKMDTNEFNKTLEEYKKKYPLTSEIVRDERDKKYNLHHYCGYCGVKLEIFSETYSDSEDGYSPGGTSLYLQICKCPMSLIANCIAEISLQKDFSLEEFDEKKIIVEENKTTYYKYKGDDFKTKKYDPYSEEWGISFTKDMKYEIFEKKEKEIEWVTSYEISYEGQNHMSKMGIDKEEILNEIRIMYPQIFQSDFDKERGKFLIKQGKLNLIKEKLKVIKENIK